MNGTERERGEGDTETLRDTEWLSDPEDEGGGGEGGRRIMHSRIAVPIQTLAWHRGR